MMNLPWLRSINGFLKFRKKDLFAQNTENLLKKILLILPGVIALATIFLIPIISDELAIAKSSKKIDFTQTIISSQDPGIGHENHQLALILSPNEGTIFDGSLTYTASKPVQIIVLHEISKDDVKDQPTWTVDNKSFYGLTVVDQGSSSGSFEFTGAALGLHTTDSDTFTTTVSVDGWVRGQPTDVIMQKIEIQKEEPTLKLARANLPITIPLHQGLFEGEFVYYIITDSSNKTEADLISKKQNWKVELAPALFSAPKKATSGVYVFKDGVIGKGIYGYQSEVFENTPNQIEEYSALRKITTVSWKVGQNAELLDSIEKIENASNNGRIKLEETNAILNMPQVVWPNGQMKIRENQTLTNDSIYGEGQILDINTENMTVTFVAHRGWGPEGETIYYIVTDATPSGPAEMMGVIPSPSSANLISSPAAVDLYQFMDGIKGAGPLGFQPGIAAGNLGDKNYSPMWRIFIVSWKNPENALILETKDDLDFFQKNGEINVSLARPMNSEHIVNCPFIDPLKLKNSTSINQ